MICFNLLAPFRVNFNILVEHPSLHFKGATPGEEELSSPDSGCTLRDRMYLWTFSYVKKKPLAQSLVIIIDINVISL